VSYWAIPSLQPYRPDVTINPGSADAPPGTPEQAAQNLQTFLVEVAHRGGQPSGTPQRVPDGDGRGRYAFDVPTDGDATVRILMPGLAIEAIRDDLRASAPCIFVDGQPWWWNDAAGQTAHALRAANVRRG
jgi:hypothetical protein